MKYNKNLADTISILLSIYATENSLLSILIRTSCSHQLTRNKHLTF